MAAEPAALVRISVVIPTYQRCASVRRALEALARQTLSAAQFEVIVPVDGSDDGTREMLEGFQAAYPLRTMWQPNRGRAAARNAGIRLARGGLIVFLDDDMEPVPGFLLAHRDAHPPGSRRAVVGPVPIIADSASPPLVHYRSSGMSAHLERLAQPGYQLGFRDVYTGNLSLPLEALHQVGGFDESFRLYGHEDYELALRLLKAGVELGYSPQALAYQHYEKDFAGMAGDSLARGQTAVLFARKHPDIDSSPKLATFHTGSRPSRLARSLMLWLSRWLPGFPRVVIGSMSWLERRRPRRLHDYYTLALDYFFWLGARSALHEPEPAAVRRMRIGLGLLVLFALFSSGRLLVRQLHQVAEITRPDEITRYEDRFQPVRRALPPQTRLGYLAGPEPQGAVQGEEAGRLAFKQYVLTQYALLPALVWPDSEGPLVIGNFEPPSSIDTGAVRGLQLIRDFGNGVVLFRRAAE